ncbi:hypothetical protein FQ775_21420 [Nitratireductor mangrovi]|uniref:Flagellar FliJ protein n=1 Tax=Nitratireductor mangrovi TaxID=2599600 RepID=A0A5B8L477_9HYPH|nr:hypothetical protein [Nitratireductor mangrovi]QDZ02725.1 hypothetical protein FQ775_21420 [Nitratireductor mangrovi]
MERSHRLARLVKVQNQLKAVHETNRAAALQEAHAAEARAEDIMARKGGDGSLSEVFPDVYERGISRAFENRDRALAKAEAEAEKVAAETARARLLERNHREASRKEERQREERAGLENVERMLAARRTSLDHK